MSNLEAQPGKQPDQVPSAEEAADALSKSVSVRSIPPPPGFLIRSLEDAWAARYPDRQCPPAAVLELVAPHWNEAVRLLKEPQGYLALRALSDRLRDRAEIAGSSVRPYDISRILTERVESVVVAEAERLGADSPVRDRMQGRSVVMAEDGWRWNQEAQGVYVLELAHHLADSLWRERSFSIRGVRKAYANETWGDMLTRVRRVAQDRARRGSPIMRESSLLNFRLAVVEQVLKEYESLGFVGPLLPGDTRVFSQTVPEIFHGRRRVGYRVLLVVLAHEAIQSDLDCQLSTSALLQGEGSRGVSKVGGVDRRAQEVIEEYGLDFAEGKETKWTHGQAKRYAEEEPIGAYKQTTELEGIDGYDGSQASRRRYFDERIEELYGCLVVGKLATVEDIALYGAFAESSDV